MSALISRAAGPLKGVAVAPGDKSISHRAVIFAASAVGRTAIAGLLEGDDVLRTIAALRAMGVVIDRESPGVWRVDGLGVGGLCEPDRVLDMGNSGTGARLLMGLVASQPITALFTGDASLRRRPMARVSDPLRALGAQIFARGGERLPLCLVGTADPVALDYELPVPSAQVKSALLLAGLNAPGETRVIEPQPTRDHTERMARHFGATVTVRERDGGGREIILAGQPELTAAPVVVPGDPSSAAFMAVAALITPGSQVTIRGVGVNPLRIGLYDTLIEMGGDLAFENRREESGEPVADLVVRASPLTGVSVPAARAPAMIDEYPVLAVAAAFAQGETIMNGLAELRIKESDRLAAIARGLAANGVAAKAGEDVLTVTGGSPADLGGGRVAVEHDHRIAMAFLVMGAAAGRPVTIDSGAMIDTSFPGFASVMNSLGANIREAAA
jgi:3-phosphoshikimate 1-carboxyvinyltransferase